MKTELNIQNDLGRRIRERRKKLGMTQAQLCSDYMTRNMLSRIETGDASPSLDTLLFISKKLKTSPAYFLCRDSKEEAEYSKIVRIKEARRALGTGQLKKCIDICQELPSDDDEVSFICVNAELMTAISLFDKGDLKDASVHIDNAATALHSTVYLYSEMLSQIKLLRLLISSLSKGVYPDSHELPLSPPVFFSKDRYFYICALSTSREGSIGENRFIQLISRDSLYCQHLRAREMIINEQYAEAIDTLQRVIQGTPDYFTLYFAICDLENAYRLSNDYKSAYYYAERRISLHDNLSMN